MSILLVDKMTFRCSGRVSQRFVDARTFGEISIRSDLREGSSGKLVVFKKSTNLHTRPRRGDASVWNNVRIHHTWKLLYDLHLNPFPFPPRNFALQV